MDKLLDPVCGMTIEDAELRAPGYDDVAFCAPGCRTAFVDNPDAYPARLDRAEPTPKKCTCGEASDSVRRCADGHDEHAHADHGSESDGDDSGCCGGHGHRGDGGHGCKRNSADHSENTPEPVASGSGCCGGARRLRP